MGIVSVFYVSSAFLAGHSFRPHGKIEAAKADICNFVLSPDIYLGQGAKTL